MEISVLGVAAVVVGTAKLDGMLLVTPPQHWENPYPNKVEKAALAAMAKISVLQVSAVFPLQLGESAALSSVFPPCR